MSNIDDFFGEAKSASRDLKDLRKQINPVIHEDPNPELYILLDEPCSSSVAHSIAHVIANCNGSRKVPVKIISVLDVKPTEKETKSGVMDFYFYKSIDLSKHIPEFSKVITMGRALYSISHDDLMIDYFYDTLLNKTHFFDPEHKFYVFPINAMGEWFKIDSFERFFALSQITKAIKFDNKPRRLIKTEKVYIGSEEDLETFYSENIGWKYIAMDTETDGFNFKKNRLGCVTVAFNSKKGYYIPWHLIKKDPVRFGQFIKDKIHIFQNGKFDVKFLWENGVPMDCLRVDIDIWNMGHLINEMRSNSLKAYAWYYTDLGGYERPLEEYLRRYPKTKNYLEIPDEILYKYATLDAVVTYQAWEAMDKEIDELDKKYPLKNGWSLRRYFQEIVMPSVNMYLEAEYRGVFINIEHLKESGKEIDDKIAEIMLEIRKYFGDTNIDSVKQLGSYIKDVLRWPCIEAGKDGGYLTNDNCLIAWKERGYKAAELLMRYRELSAVKKTYTGSETEGSGYWQYVVRHDDGTWRVHPKFSTMLAESHRNKCGDPNLQNLPSHSEEQSRIVKFYFCTPDDAVYNFLAADFSGLQLRLAAMQLPDGSSMKKVFTDLSGDMHSMTAVAVLMNNKITIEEFMKRKKEKPYSEIRFKSKCFTGDTLIKTDKGNLRIDEIVPQKSPGKLVPYEGDIKLMDRNDHIKLMEYTYFGYTDELIDFELENGDTITVTPEHRMVIQRDGVEMFMRADRVTESDRIIKV